MSSQRTDGALEGRAWKADAQLVNECLKNSETAWSELIDKYKNLIYSIAIKYELSPNDSADIFQSVVVELLMQLPNLREPKALPAWLIQVTSHKCIRWKRGQQRLTSVETEALPLVADATADTPEGLLREVEREQSLREARQKLPPRCRELVRMLFYEAPPRPYEEIAQQLGIAKGSIGFIRQRCLERLRSILEEQGFS